MIGINLAGAEFGRVARGQYGTDYIYPGTADLDYFAGKGIELVRLPFGWERMQPTLGGALDPAELGRLKAFLADAAAHGMKVVVDLHNYGRYDGATIGSGAVSKEAFADFWAKLAGELAGNPAVYGYGLMNEPHDMGDPMAWPAAAQAALYAIRGVDDDTTVIVSGDSYASAKRWPETNWGLPINDPANNVVYEAHAYFDNDQSGVYDSGYDAEGAYPNVGIDNVRPFLNWLEENGQRGFLGEFGVPNDDPRWLDAMGSFLDALQAANVDATYWAGGPWWDDYKLSISPTQPGVDRPQMDRLEAFVETVEYRPAIRGDAADNWIDGTAANDLILGLDGRDTIAGGAGSDLLDGGRGSDTLRGGDGDDKLYGQKDDDSLYGEAGNDRLWGNTGNDSLWGGSGDDRLDGGEGWDILDGGDGADRLYGGPGGDRLVGRAGDDVYVVDGFDDIIDESAADSSGSDTVSSSVSFSLADGSRVLGSVENLTLTGGAGIDATGNALANRLTGNSGANMLNGASGSDWLDGGGGIDNLIGGSGDDTYVVDNAADRVMEFAGEGTDVVFASVTYALATDAAVERLAASLQAGIGAINLTGNGFDQTVGGNNGANILNGLAGNDTLFGYAGNDILNGGAGIDTMSGGTGNDVFYVDNAADRVVEAAGTANGADTVYASVTYALATDAAVERLAASLQAGIGAINLTGNGFDQTVGGNNGANILNGLAGNDTLFGYAGNDILNGGAGIDTMSGGTGNDVFYVDNAADRVVEAAGTANGADTVYASVSYALATDAAVERLVASLQAGTGALNFTGNGFDQTIGGNNGANILSGLAGNDALFGYDGNDILNGGAGIDTMSGGTGNDVFYVDNAADRVVEAAGTANGSDTVYASVSYALATDAAVERLATGLQTGTGAINFTGNGFAQTLHGNNGANILNGLAGNDVLSGFGGNDRLYGGLGNDVLTGGLGNDTFLFNTALSASANVDVITDFSAPADTIWIDNAVFASPLLPNGALAAGRFAANADGIAKDADDRIVYETDTGKLFYDSNGSAAGGAVQFATLSAHPAITHADFIVI